MSNESPKEHEYPDAPSGFVYLYNYKEPFMPFVGGHGYEGVLLMDGERDKVQCHYCGGWFETLGNHLRRGHNMTAADYKRNVGLNKYTALISDSYRAKLIANGEALAKRMKNLRIHRKHTEATKAKIRATLKENRRETQNVHGTCPEQLIQRLRAKHDELGRTPTQDEIKGMYDTIRKVWGSFKRACEMAGIPHREPSTGRLVEWERMPEQDILFAIRECVRSGKKPTMSAFAHVIRRSDIKRYGGWDLLVDKAIVAEGKTRRALSLKYSDADLLERLNEFKEKYGRKASTSDFRRGLLPNYKHYTAHFGGVKEALRMLGPVKSSTQFYGREKKETANQD